MVVRAKVNTFMVILVKKNFESLAYESTGKEKIKVKKKPSLQRRSNSQRSRPLKDTYEGLTKKSLNPFIACQRKSLTIQDCGAKQLRTTSLQYIKIIQK